ncbi:MAG TPA: aminotransferase class I/II-fold pyridoxal phosphate-dependent enzyme, partial [Candidatus Glassbacteria bacterium]|nr:aminotransferase class I/II-fold pyridoxal phosphate-dependent enzyme [Candidatus Glassbacteria bacterium]
QLYGTRRTFFLTGGTTQGILAGCLVIARRGRRVLLARNCHVSMINGAVLAGLDPEYIQSAGKIPAEEEFIAALENRRDRPAALVITNPGYEGGGIEIGNIAGHCREAGILLVVDEAHGTHFPFTEGAPASAITVQGCDLVFHSLHKYLGSFVQTGLAHVPQESQIDGEEFRRALELLESTTRSNLLMLSIEEALARAFSTEGRNGFRRTAENVGDLHRKLSSFGEVLSCSREAFQDPLKLFLTSDRAPGAVIAERFLARGIDNEFFTSEGSLYIFSFRNASEQFRQFESAAGEVYHELAGREKFSCPVQPFRYNIPVMRNSPREAFMALEVREVPLREAVGRINCTNYVKCPPGIPVLIPGEEITAWHVENLPGEWKIRVMA